MEHLGRTRYSGNDDLLCSFSCDTQEGKYDSETISGPFDGDYPQTAVCPVSCQRLWLSYSGCDCKTMRSIAQCPMRISGCISYVLNEEMRQNGHLYLKQDALIKSVLNLLNEDQTLDQITESEINGVLYRLAVQHSIVVDDDRIYRVTQYEEERRTAMMIAKRLMKQIPAESIEKELEEAQKVLGITLSDCQKEAVRMVFRSPISIITGGPGTGKTTVLKVILYIHKGEIQNGSTTHGTDGTSCKKDGRKYRT